MSKFTQQFDSYVCEYDSISCEHGIMTVTATIEYDTDTKPTDYDCYSARKIKQWQRDEWFFCTVVLSVSIGDIELTDYAACLSGVECNYNKRSNKYLRDVANELLPEAIDNATEVLESLLAAVKQGEKNHA